MFGLVLYPEGEDAPPEGAEGAEGAIQPKKRKRVCCEI